MQLNICSQLLWLFSDYDLSFNKGDKMCNDQSNYLGPGNYFPALPLNFCIKAISNIQKLQAPIQRYIHCGNTVWIVAECVTEVISLESQKLYLSKKCFCSVEMYSKGDKRLQFDITGAICKSGVKMLHLYPSFFLFIFYFFSFLFHFLFKLKKQTNNKKKLYKINFRISSCYSLDFI